MNVITRLNAKQINRDARRHYLNHETHLGHLIFQTRKVIARLSGGAHPPRANPRALAFQKKRQIPGGGDK